MRVDALIAGALAWARTGPGTGDLALLLEALADVPVRASTDVPTAAIRSLGGRYEMQLNPQFCARYVRDGESALALLGHELLHARRGHFGLTIPANPGERLLQNIALDILVNAALMRGWVTDACTLFRDVNPADRFPGCLLVPPSQMEAGEGIRFLLAGARSRFSLLRRRFTRSLRTAVEERFARFFAEQGCAHPGAVARVYLRGWLEVPEPTAYWMEFRAIILPELIRRGDQLAEVVLLGDHGQDGTLAGRLPNVDGVGSGHDPEEGCADPRPPVAAVRRKFFAAVEKALSEGSAASGPGPVWRTSPGVVPSSVGRREVFALGAGAMPALWSPAQLVRDDTDAGVHLFADVSGSTSELAPFYFSLTQMLGSRLIRPAWQWSTQVHALSEEAIRTGRMRTTGGTEIRCVLEHARRKRMRKVLILTDGIFGIDEQDVRLSRDLHVVVMVTGRLHHCPEELPLVADAVIEVPERLFEAS